MNDVSLMPSQEGAFLSQSASQLALASIPTTTQQLLSRMFADPRVLETPERTDLVAGLRVCVAENPEIAELRVLLGMALCVNLEAQAAMEELGEAVGLAPDSFIAHLKMGELWMRLRVINKAEDHTRHASLLAQNLAQSELARRQAATIRIMKREGIERGGYRTHLPSFAALRRITGLRRLWARNRGKELATVEAR